MKDQLNVALGRVMKELRESRGLTQQQLAGICGVDQTTIAKLETGIHMPRNETWSRLLHPLRVSLAEVMTMAHERTALKGGRQVSALDPDEAALVAIYQDLTAQGRRILMDRAKACLTLHAKPRK